MSIISKLISQILPESDKISVIDCGAKGGGEGSRWKELGNSVIIHGFDPDEAECLRLNSSAKQKGLQHHYYPICLGRNNNENRNFYLTKQTYSHSLYMPNEQLLERWKQVDESGNFICTSENLGVEKVIEVKTTSLDAWAEDSNIRDIDFIKLDVQGAELEILTGGNKLLQSVIGLEVEVEFSPLYEEQPLFADIDIFLRQQGFTFFDLKFTHTGHFAGRMASPISVMHEGDMRMAPQIAGQLVTADALYLLDPIAVQAQNIKELSEFKVLKLACIAEICGQLEFAFELLTWLSKLLAAQGFNSKAAVIEQFCKQAHREYVNLAKS